MAGRAENCAERLENFLARAGLLRWTSGKEDDIEGNARAQAKAIAAEIEAQDGPKGLADKEIVAIIAYLQRLGTDIKVKPAAEEGASK